MHFVCNSWFYPANLYKKKDNIFFTNKVGQDISTTRDTIATGQVQRGRVGYNGEGELQEWDRVYDYACYNDLGDPDSDPKHDRPTLGGSAEFPYPRRGRTGRPPSKSDTKVESRLPLLKSLEIYVPRDEKFGPQKLSDFLFTRLKSIIQLVKPELEDLFSKNPREFDSFEDALKIYGRGIKLHEDPALDCLWKNVPSDIINRIFHTDGELILKYPLPEVLKESRTAWRTDQEFAREMLAGLNPVIIRLLQV
ncbi:Linoleate 9S-lipoxygenase 1 [Linum perenne]